MNPLSNLRADFQIGETYIEYMGFRGQDEFQKKIEEKEELCKRNNLKLVRLYTEDLLSLDIVKRKLRDFFPPASDGAKPGAGDTQPLPPDSGTDVKTAKMEEQGPSAGEAEKGNSPAIDDEHGADEKTQE
jgi:hypothetical protein